MRAELHISFQALDQANPQVSLACSCVVGLATTISDTLGVFQSCLNETGFISANSSADVSFSGNSTALPFFRTGWFRAPHSARESSTASDSRPRRLIRDRFFECLSSGDANAYLIGGPMLSFVKTVTPLDLAMEENAITSRLPVR